MRFNLTKSIAKLLLAALPTALTVSAKDTFTVVTGDNPPDIRRDVVDKDYL